MSPGRRVETLMDLGRYCLSRDGAAEAAAAFAEAKSLTDRVDGMDSIRTVRVRAFEFAALRAAGRPEATDAIRMELEARFEKFPDRTTAEARTIRTLLDGQPVPWP